MHDDHASVPIPQSADAVTPDWVIRLLQATDPSTPPPSPGTIKIVPIGTGQMASSLRVSYAASNSGDQQRSFVVKIAADNPASRRAGGAGAYMKEVRFYQLIAETVTIDVPVCLFSQINDETQDFVLVLEDMHPSVQGDQIAGCSLGEVEAALANLVGLQAPRWGDTALFEHAWLGTPPHESGESDAFVAAVMADFTTGFIERYASRLDDSTCNLLTWFAARTENWLASNTDTWTLTHADYRLDNLLFRSGDALRNEPPRVTAVDWQTLTIRNGAADVAYLLGTSIEPDVRRKHERRLLESFHTQLVAGGVRDYAFATFFQDYIRCTFHSLLITVLGSMMTGPTARGDDMFMAMLKRSVCQINDLDATSSL